MSSARVVALVLLITTVGGACAASPTASYLPAGSAKSVYLVSHGWHTGLVLRRADVSSGIWPEIVDFLDAEHLEVGWGDWDFYQAREFSLWKAAKALFWPTRSVLHIVSFNGSVARYFPKADIVEIKVSEEGFERLCVYLSASYLRPGSDKALPLGRGLYGNSRFYPAQGTFHLFRTCNVWMAEALASMGYPMSASFAITASELMRQARQLGRVIPSEATGH